MTRCRKGKGIAMLSNDTFRGIDLTHVYHGHFEDEDGKLDGRVKAVMYAPPSPPAGCSYMGGYTLKVDSSDSRTRTLEADMSHRRKRSRMPRTRSAIFVAKSAKIQETR
jgi:hypothetical protein